MTLYSHTQRAGRWVWLVIGMAGVLVAVAALTRLWAVLLAVPLLGVAVWLFGSLTITVDEHALAWRFGPGLIRRSVPRPDLASARVVKTTLLEGWGIHYTRHGWLYNVAGFDALALTLRNGKGFALGTDEPERLLAALALPLPGR